MTETVGDSARLGIRWLGGARVLTVTFNMVATFVAIRLLRPEDFGTAAVAAMLVGFVGLFNDAGLATSLVRASSLTDEQVDRTQGLIVVANVITFMILAAFAPAAERFFGFDGLSIVVIVAGLQLLIQGPVAAPGALLQRAMRFRLIASCAIAEGITSGAVMVLLAVIGAGVWALVIGPLVGCVVRGAIVLSVIERIPRPRPSFEGMAETLRFGGTLTAGQLIWAAYTRADTIIVGRVLGNSVLGFYSVAMQVATLPMEKVAGILNAVGFAAFANVQHDSGVVREKFLWVTRTAAGIAVPIFWGIAAVSREIAEIVLGAKWLPVAVPLLLVCLPVPLRFLSSLIEPVMLALGRADIALKNVLAASAIMVPAFLVGARWGLIGVCAAWPIGYFAFFLYRTTVALRVIGIPVRDYWLAVRSALLSGMIMFGAVVFARTALEEIDLHPILNLALLMAIGAFAYVVVSAAVNRRLLQDLRSLLVLKR